jgi:hypothetical protein
MIETIAILDAQGRLQHASTYQPRRRFSPYSGDKEHFRVHAEASADTLFISAPIEDPISHEALIHLTRGIWQQHRFAGEISIPLWPEYLFEHLLSLRVDPSDILAVVRPDGSTLARSNGLVEAMKSKLPPDRPFLNASPGAAGQFRSTSTFDKVPVLFSWQRMQDWPLITVAAVNEATELAPPQPGDGGGAPTHCSDHCTADRVVHRIAADGDARLAAKEGAALERSSAPRAV